MIQQKRLLTFENVGFAYEDAPYALRGINLTVGEGERVAVLGANGAGKSTFFLLCNGVISPTEGRLLFEEREVTHNRKELLRLRERVGIVFQDPNQQLIGSTVEAEVSFGPMNLGLDRADVVHRVNRSLAEMNLIEMRERPPHFLSGGEKKRVTIADVLAMEPRVILFDEPTASLDHENSRMLEQLLEKLTQKGHTLMVSTHDVDFAWRWAERALVFGNGRLLKDSKPEHIFADTKLLHSARLPKPILCEIADVLGLDSWPRSLEELRRQANTNLP